MFAHKFSGRHLGWLLVAAVALAGCDDDGGGSGDDPDGAFLDGQIGGDSGRQDAGRRDAARPDPDSTRPDPDGDVPDPDGDVPDPDGDVPDVHVPDPDGDVPDPDGEVPDPDGEVPDPDGEVPPQCVADADCLEGQRCADGVCVPVEQPECRVDADCDEDHRCVQGVCVPDLVPGCESDEECAANHRCVDGACIPDVILVCQADADCDQGQICVDGACVPDVGPRCQADADCDQGQICVDGACVPEVGPGCVTDEDCEEGQGCVDGACIPVVGPECIEDGDCDEGESCIAGRCQVRAPGCASDEECAPNERCVEGECVVQSAAACDAPVVLEGFGRIEGNSLLAAAEVGAGCGGGARGREVAYVLPAALGEVCLDTFGSSYDTVLHVRTDCNDAATEVACNDDAPGALQSRLQLEASDVDRVIFVDGFPVMSGGRFVLSVQGGPCADDRPCQGDEACDEGEVCSQGFCRPAPVPQCVEDVECGDGLVCLDGRCGVPPPRECEANDECFEGELCVDGICRLAPAGDACGAPIEVDAPGRWQGTTVGASSLHGASCGGGAASNEVAYRVQAGLGVVCVDTFGSSYDTVLFARAECGVRATEIACNDDALGFQSRIQVDATEADVFVFVDGFGQANSGAYVLTIAEGECPEGPARCEDDSQCSPDRACVDGACVSRPECEENADCGEGLECTDGRCVPPPECREDVDCGEGDICEFGACRPAQCEVDENCPPGNECQGGRCIIPPPRECEEAADCFEGELCIEGICRLAPSGDTCDEPIEVAAPGQWQGSTAGMSSLHGASCGGDAQSPEVAYRVAAGLGVVCVDTFGSSYDTVLFARAECGVRATEVACNDDPLALQSRIQIDTTEGDVFVFVDGFGGGNSGDYVLTITAGPCPEGPARCEADAQCPPDRVCRDGECVLPPECEVDEECEGDLVCVGGACVPEPDCREDADCEEGLVCREGVCQEPPPPPCVEDGECPDGQICETPFPGFPGICVDAECGPDRECPEGTECDGGRCVAPPPPACEENADCDEGFLCMDGSCRFAPGGDGCDEPTLIDEPGQWEGTTQGASALYGASCGGQAASPEQVFEIAAGLGVVCVDTFGSQDDTVLHARAACRDAESELACNDDASGLLQSQIQIDVTEGPAFVFVDGFAAQSSGPFTLNVTLGPCGQEPPECLDDEACGEGFICRDGFCQPEPPEFCEGDADCPFGFICRSNVCVEGFPGQCVNNDDCEEGQVCVDGQCQPGVEPECAINADCGAERLCVEGECQDPRVPFCEEAVSIDEFGRFSGDTLDASAVFSATCGAGARGPERVFLLGQNLGRVCVDTIDSGFDTVLHARADCLDIESQVACNDDLGGGPTASRLQLDTSDGPLFVYVDAFGVNERGNYLLRVRPGDCADPIACEEDGDCNVGNVCLDGVCGVPPLPDACEFAEEIAVPGSYEGTTEGAGSNYTATCGSQARSPEVAYVIPAGVGVVCVDTRGSAFDTVLHARTECRNPESQVACNDDGPGLGGQSEIEVDASNTAVFVFVDGFGAGSRGDFVLNVRRGRCGEEPNPARLLIAELDIDQPGNDRFEFIEIYNPGAAPFPLAGVVLRTFDVAGNLRAEFALAQAGPALPGGGRLIIGNAAVFSVTREGTLGLEMPLNTLTNSGLGLWLGLADAQVVFDAMSYGPLIPGITEGQPAGLDNPDLRAFGLSRCPDGRDTDDNRADFFVAPSTPGLPNNCDF